MSGLIMLFLCLLAGVVLRRFNAVPENGHLVLNTFVLYVSLPALTLLYIPSILLSLNLLYPVAVAWIVYLAAAGLFIIIGRIAGWDKATIGCMILCCGLCNSSFIGYPVIKALYGDEGLKTAILVDQPGSFMVLSTLGIFTAIYFSSGKPSAKIIARKLFTFPPFIAFLLGAVLLLTGFKHTAFTKEILEPIGNTMIPLALVSLGLQLKPELRREELKELSLGLSYKLAIAPFIIYLLYVAIGKAGGIPIQVSILEAAMAPMITGAILATEYNLKPKLASMFVGIGIPLSFLTLMFWYWLVKGV